MAKNQTHLIQLDVEMQSDLWKRTLDKYCVFIDDNNAWNYRVSSLWKLKKLLCDENSKFAYRYDGPKTNLPLSDREFIAFCHVIKDFSEHDPNEMDRKNAIERMTKALSLLLGCEVDFEKYEKGEFRFLLATCWGGNHTFIHFDDSLLGDFESYAYLSQYL